MNLDKDQKEEEEKETLVLVQFTDLDDANYCQQFSSQLKTIEITSEKPIIQIGNRLYSGEYTNNLGTYLFFEEKEINSKPEESASSSSSSATSENASSEFAYSGKSFKKLVLTRLFVEENSDNNQEQPGSSGAVKDWKIIISLYLNKIDF